MLHKSILALALLSGAALVVPSAAAHAQARGAVGHSASVRVGRVGGVHVSTHTPVIRPAAVHGVVRPGGVVVGRLPVGFRTFYRAGVPAYWYPAMPVGFRPYPFGGVIYYTLGGVWLQPYWYGGAPGYMVVPSPI